MAKYDIGLIGLAVMGENLVLNMEDHGFSVAVFNRTTSKVDNFIKGRAKGKNIKGCYSIEELVDSLERPRKVMLLVKAGKPVDEFIDMLIPHLEQGDIIIDGGNSYFPDTIRRTKYVEDKELLYIGTGVSGGEEGALRGPSIMPGGSEKAWPHVKEIFQSIAAKVADGSPCCEWVGKDGAGHFVKMVHNGIEYGLMQSYAEGFEIMKHRKEYDLDLYQIAQIWQHGSIVRSWLLDLTVAALEKDQDLKDIKDWVADSGEGRWIAADAIELDVPAPVITLSLMMRFISRMDESYAAKLLAALRNQFGGHAVKEN